MNKLNDEKWDSTTCKLNRMVNYRIMRYLLGRKRNFFNPFEGILSRGKMDRIVKLESFVSPKAVEALSKTLGMEMDIFTGEKRLRFIERQGSKVGSIYLTENNWETYLNYEEALIYKKPLKNSSITYSSMDSYVKEFNERLYYRLKEVLEFKDGEFSDTQLKRYVYYIKHGFSYNENYLERKYKQLIIDLKSSNINDLKLLDDGIMRNYMSALKKQMDRINAIMVFRDDGIIPKNGNEKQQKK